MEPTIYCITGVMAAGKSTVSECLAGMLYPSVHLRGDVFRRMMVNGREEMSEELSPAAMEQLTLRYRLAAEAAKIYHAAGFHVVMQDNYYGEMLPFVVGLLKPIVPQVAVLCPTVETVAHRESTRGKAGYVGFSVQSLYDSFMATTPRIGLWIDNSNETPEETARRILLANGDD